MVSLGYRMESTVRKVRDFWEAIDVDEATEVSVVPVGACGAKKPEGFGFCTFDFF